MNNYSGNIEVDNYMITLFKQLENFQELQAEIVSATETSHAADEAVTVTVGPSGNLLDLQLSSRVRRLEAHEIGDAIKEAYKSACNQMTTRINNLLGPMIPGNTSIGDQIIGTTGLPVVQPDGEIGDAIQKAFDLFANRGRESPSSFGV